MEATRDKRPPQWLVLLVVIATAGVTVWAIWQTGLQGPMTSWNTAQQAVQQIWTAQPGAAPAGAAMQPPPQQSPQSPASAEQVAAALGAAPAQAAPAPDDPATRTVAGLPGVPVIMWGANRPHPDRGACTTCHNVVRGNGTNVPIIHSFSVMPHGYRGVCINCHQVTPAGVNPVAGMMTQPPPFAQVLPQQAPPLQALPQLAPPQTQPPRPPPNEAEWRGLEVRAASQGVVVTKSDGTAARMGVQPGDVVQSINGITVNDMTGFVQATQDGRLMQGTLIARRANQRLAFELGANANGAAMAPQPGDVANGVNAF